jgi:hypothetical protein
MRKTSKLIILSFLVTISTGYLPNTIINTISNTTKAQAEETGKRKALVIGNKDYSNGDELKNTINDANAISSKLSKLGFEVSNYSNLETKDDMRRKLIRF